MKHVSLPFVTSIDKNLKKTPQFIQVILGPRQVGKTTTVLAYLNKNFFEKHHYYSAEGKTANGASWLKQVWLKARQEQMLLVIDEIQKIENWAEAVKTLWDEDKRLKVQIKCILLGSSSLDLHMGLTESLTGRFQLIHVYQWNFLESKEGYNLSFDDYIKFGGYPGSYALRNDLQEWQKYVRQSIIDTVIEKDILVSHKVKSPALFKQAFDLLISYPAQEISFTKLLGQLQDKGNTDLIKYYIRLFEGAFLVKTLEKFSTNKIKIRTSAPKIIPLCPAFSFINELDDYSGETRGHVFESLVGATLHRLGFELFYWRDGSHEVDFVLKFGKRIWAIEVKSGRKKKMQGMDQFLKQFPHANPVLITPDNYVDFESDPIKFLDV